MREYGTLFILNKAGRYFSKIRSLQGPKVSLNPAKCRRIKLLAEPTVRSIGIITFKDIQNRGPGYEAQVSALLTYYKLLC